MELIYALILAAVAVPAPAPPPIVVTPSGVELEKLADNTMIPGTVGSFFFIETLAPEACGEKILFTGFDERARLGLYSASASGVELIADTTTVAPGSGGATFEEAREPRCVGKGLFFRGSVTPNVNLLRSLYSWSMGSLDLLLEEGLPIADAVLRSIIEMDANDAGFVMLADLNPSSVDQGMLVQRFDGEPFIVADLTTVLPGQTEPALVYGTPVAAGHDAVFQARTGLESAIYRWNEAAGLSIVVDDQTPVPALGGQSLSGFILFTSLDDGIVFTARYAGETAIFIAREDRVIEPLVLPGDVTVDGEMILSASRPRGEGTLLAFNGAINSPFDEIAFVRKHDGSIQRLLSSGEMLGGLPVHGVIVDADSENVALRVHHGPGSQAVYRASFPAPAQATTEIPTLTEIGIGLLTLTLALAGLKLLRRSA